MNTFRDVSDTFRGEHTLSICLEDFLRGMRYGDSKLHVIPMNISTQELRTWILCSDLHLVVSN